MNRRRFVGGAALAGAATLLAQAAPTAAAARGSSGTVVPAPGPTADPLAHVNLELRPAAQMMMRAMPASTGKIDAKTLVAGRAMMPAPPRLAVPDVTARSVPGPRGAPDVAIFIINAKAGGRRPVIVHLHGGGFVLGSAAGAIAMMQAQALALDCVVVTVDYRLAPETPFPGPLEDAYAALRWTFAHCAEIGGDPARIAIQGESAGGGLAAMLAIATRDRGEVPLVHQSLVYPMLDDRTGGERQVAPPIGTLAWTAPLNQVAWGAFLGKAEGSKATPPAGSVPARVSDLRQLPPAFIGVGAIDLFIGEDLDYARCLIEAAVPAELVVVPGAFHGFDVIAGGTTVARQFRHAQLNALARAFGAPAVDTWPS
jgi:acetyl esterase/lipase